MSPILEKALGHLVDFWNVVQKSSQLSDMDRYELCQIVHRAQDMLLAKTYIALREDSHRDLTHTMRAVLDQRKEEPAP